MARERGRDERRCRMRERDISAECPPKRRGWTSETSEIQEITETAESREQLSVRQYQSQD